jgi:hypothetical protein
MKESHEELTESELKKKAYSIGLRLKNSRLDADTILARLDKEGIPEEMAHEVVRDIFIELQRKIVEQTTPVYNFALIRIGIGLVVALVSYLILPDNYIVPSAIIIGGIVSALLAKKRMEG